jgi:phospholipase D3/4
LYPETVHFKEWSADAWFGGGIMHQKIWVSDRKHVYVGSANMDWLSLCQVKEMGIVVENSTAIGRDLGAYFDAWWAFAAAGEASPTNATVAAAFSPKYQVTLTKPCWSALVPPAQRCANPLPNTTGKESFTWERPMQATLNGQACNLFISGSPQEVLPVDHGTGDDDTAARSGAARSGAAGSGAAGSGAAGSGAVSHMRTWDQDGIVKTILDAKTTVSLSVMDFIPNSLYNYEDADGKAQPLWWSAFTEAMLTAATTKNIRVRLLISHWAHTSPRIIPYLAALESMGAVCAVPAGLYNLGCNGTLEVKLFEVPGWNATDGPDAVWPPYSRVNHAKYVVTDRRINVGTSNHAWSYFYSTAGSSFNTDHADLRATLQRVFDRDWDSPYAVGLASHMAHKQQPRLGD